MGDVYNRLMTETCEVCGGLKLGGCGCGLWRWLYTAGFEDGEKREQNRSAGGWGDWVAYCRAVGEVRWVERFDRETGVRERLEF